MGSLGQPVCVGAQAFSERGVQSSHVPYSLYISDTRSLTYDATVWMKPACEQTVGRWFEVGCFGDKETGEEKKGGRRLNQSVGNSAAVRRTCVPTG